MRPTDAALVLGQTLNALKVPPGPESLSTATILLTATLVEAAHGNQKKIDELIEASRDAMVDLSRIMVENAMKSLDPSGNA